MDIDNPQVERTIREIAERTQITKKCSIPVGLITAIINDDAKIPTIIKYLASRQSSNGRNSIAFYPKYNGRNGLKK